MVVSFLSSCICRFAPKNAKCSFNKKKCSKFIKKKFPAAPNRIAAKVATGLCPADRAEVGRDRFRHILRGNWHGIPSRRADGVPGCGLDDGDAGSPAGTPRGHAQVVVQ